MTEQYKEPEDLLSDESFLAWYFKEPGGMQEKWDHWMSGRPDRIRLVQQAVSLLEETRMPERPLPVQQIAKAEERLFAQIDAAASAPAPSAPAPASAPPGITTPLFNRRRWMVAASILALLGAGMWLTTINKKSSVEIITAYGQQTRQQLPDGTTVTLNANSKLSYNKSWATEADREVWVDGEAFFHVTHTPANSKFIVHAAHIYVVVTGTQFNVINRPDAENVFLKEGRVIVGSRKENEEAMSPGDFVTWKQDALENKVVKADSLMAWQEHRLIFSQTHLKDLASILGNQYGVKVDLETPGIADSAISAILPNNDLDVLIKALNATSEYEVVRKNDLITIRSHPGQK
ncbi:MAG: FecR domain-containing protein [Bacteroidetes bacterium]|nr:FecR domain-containing protein [Bacteroidota bacterium]